MSSLQNSSKVLPGPTCLSILAGRRAVKPGALWILANVSQLDVGMLVIQIQRFGSMGMWRDYVIN